LKLHILGVSLSVKVEAHKVFSLIPLVPNLLEQAGAFLTSEDFRAESIS
jgi:hypothetical protein